LRTNVLLFKNPTLDFFRPECRSFFSLTLSAFGSLALGFELGPIRW